MRSFTDGRIEGEIKDALDKEVAACNSEGGLRIQLVTDEPEAFGGFMSRHSDFSNVRNYIALVGADNTESREKLDTTANAWSYWHRDWDSTAAGWH